MKAVFSPRQILGVMRAGDSHRYGIEIAKEGPAIAERVAAVISDRTLDLRGYVRGTARGKPCVNYKNFDQVLALRLLSTYLTRRYRINPPNRDRIVGGVIETMRDGTPFTIIRRDIASFYESIDTDGLRKKLVFDTSIPRDARHLLDLYFSLHCPPGSLGVPRGVGLSAILAELSITPFDRTVTALAGVYRYFRYADDILVFCFERPNDIVAEIDAALPANLTFNIRKSSSTDFTAKTAAARSIDYLGYQFQTRTGAGSSEPREIEVSISDNKIRRIKTRVILALKCFQKDRDGHLLIDRLKVLSSNFRVRRIGKSSYAPQIHSRSGIFYNYSSCGIYRGAAFEIQVPTALAELDNFTHHLLRGPRSEFRALLKSELSSAQWQQLSRLSFRLGFANKRMVRVKHDRLATIREAWRNA